MDYQGFDQEDKLKWTIKNVELIEQLTRKYYLERVEKFDKTDFEANPSLFRFADENNCSILALIYPFEYDYQVKCNLFFLSTPGIRNIKAHVVSEEDLSGVDTFSSSHLFTLEKLLPQLGYDRFQIMFRFLELYTNYSSRNLFSSNDFSIQIYEVENEVTVRRQVLESIQSDVANFKNISQTESSYFAKDVAKFPFSIMDLKPLLDAVNDNDFSYQLDQAMAAYHQNLFLPCAATLGVCLETVCLKICELNNVETKGADTQLGKLRIMLYEDKEKRIITRRENSRLEVAYKMRNMASHSSPGETLREDCHFMLTVMNEIAHQHLQPTASI